MEQTYLSLMLSAIPAVLCALAIVLVILTKKENKLLAQQLTETSIALEQTRRQLAEIKEKQAAINEFQDSLKMAELTTRLQHTRLQSQSVENNPAAPDKYSHLQALAEKGKSVEEIAATLSISIHEAQQLVNLSRLAQTNIAAAIAV